MTKRIVATFGVDVDAVAGWLGSYGGGDSPSDIQRGIFAAEVGIPRLLRLFERKGITASWFVPGHSLESFPEELDMVIRGGHEIGAHGYSHENPRQMSREQEEDVLGKSIEIIVKATGSAPRGYVAPWWESSPHTMELLVKFGFSYDHSQSYQDFTVAFARSGDTWTNIDYTRPAKSWMTPLVRGPKLDLVEIPANWYLDDLPPMMFIKGAANSHGFVAPADIEMLWREQFDWVYAEMEDAVFPISIHPDVSGRPQVLLMLERLIDYISAHANVVWAPMERIAADFRRERVKLSDS